MKAAEAAEADIMEDKPILERNKIVMPLEVVALVLFQVW